MPCKRNIKRIILVLSVFLFTLDTHTGWAIPINNGLNGFGFFEVDVLDAGESRQGNKGTGQNQVDLIFDLFHYIDVGATGSQAVRLSESTTSPAALEKDAAGILTGNVVSSGSIKRLNLPDIDWMTTSRIKPFSQQYSTNFAFSAPPGTLGDLRLIQYLDADIPMDDFEDDRLIVNPGFLRTVDSPTNFETTERLSLSQRLTAGPTGPNIGATSPFITEGWVADVWNNIKPALQNDNFNFGNNNYFLEDGNILNLSEFTGGDPGFGGVQAFGNSSGKDIVHAVSFITQATNTSSLLAQNQVVDRDFVSLNLITDVGTPIPEPSTLLFLTTGLVGLGAARWLRRR